MSKAIVVTGTASGVGKTTVTLAMMAALRRRGLVVQGFKIGPDFIDPAFHALVTGRPSYTLDGWMCGRAAVCAAVAQHGADADVVVIEGMMGCFDGIDGVSEDGSTAQVAKWLAAPVVLVVDARAASRSVAAVAFGFEQFDPSLDLAAVIVNNVGSVTHGRWVLDAIAQRCRAVGLGALARDAQLTLPERHLGLVTAAEGPLTPERMNALADSLERAIDLDRLLTIADRGAPMRTGAGREAGGAGASASPAISRSSSITKRISHGCAPPALCSSPGAPRPRPSFPTSTDSTSAAAIPSCARKRWPRTSASVGPCASSSRRAVSSMQSAAASCISPRRSRTTRA